MKRGFTLIETVITIAIALVLVLATTQLYVVYGRMMLVEQAAIQITLGGSSIMDATRDAGLQAVHVVATHSFSGVTYTSATSTVIFELPTVDQSGTIVAGSYDYVAISASSTDVYQFTDAAVGSSRMSGQKQLTSVLGTLSFTYDSASLTAVTNVLVDATMSAVVRGATTTVHFRERIYLRNI